MFNMYEISKDFRNMRKKPMANSNMNKATISC